MGNSATTEALRFSSSDGAVVGVPRRWLRLEGLTLLLGSLVAYSTTRQAWWLVPVTLLSPDLLMVGYLAGTRSGGSMYNLAHTTSLPAALIGLGWWQHQRLALALGLVWLAHIGMDRLMGYGLKYDDNLQHTHLGHMTRALFERQKALCASCLALAVVFCACISAGGHGVAYGAAEVGRRGPVITLGSFDFPESVLLAYLYAGALAATGFPVRVLPDVGTRELVDPALLSGLVQIVPEYSGSALEFLSVGRLSATSSSWATSRALSRWAAREGLVAGRPSGAQDTNVIVVTAATAARYGLRSVADLARWAPRLVFGGPPECPESVYCLPGLRRTYGFHFGEFIGLDAGACFHVAGLGGWGHQRRVAVQYRPRHYGTTSRGPQRRSRPSAGRERGPAAAPQSVGPLRSPVCRGAERGVGVVFLPRRCAPWTPRWSCVGSPRGSWPGAGCGRRGWPRRGVRCGERQDRDGDLAGRFGQSFAGPRRAANVGPAPPDRRASATAAPGVGEYQGMAGARGCRPGCRGRRRGASAVAAARRSLQRRRARVLGPVAGTVADAHR